MCETSAQFLRQFLRPLHQMEITDIINSCSPCLYIWTDDCCPEEFFRQMASDFWFHLTVFHAFSRLFNGIGFPMDPSLSKLTYGTRAWRLTFTSHYLKGMVGQKNQAVLEWISYKSCKLYSTRNCPCKANGFICTDASGCNVQTCENSGDAHRDRVCWRLKWIKP